MPIKEQEKIIKKCALKSNKEQRDFIQEYKHSLKEPITPPLNWFRRLIRWLIK